MLKAPFLRTIALMRERAAPEKFPFNLPLLAAGEFALSFERPITFVVGENGTGKSTLLEAIAAHCEFDPLGGARTPYRRRSDDEELPPEQALARALRFAWKPRVTNGFFFRAESFHQVATRLDYHSAGSYGGRELHAQSHGEAFMALFQDRFGSRANSLYILDEPEAALSPTRQMAFLALIDRWHRTGRVQAIIATHAPMLMAYPEAAILSLDDGKMTPVAFRETNHYRRLKSFLDRPESYLRALLEDSDEAKEDDSL